MEFKEEVPGLHRDAPGLAHPETLGERKRTMWEVPKAISIVAGAGEGSTEINAFDRALLDAGIANLNFIRVTSILPPQAKIVPLRAIVPGRLTPAVYTRVTSREPGNRIAAAIAVGISREDYGVIMEEACYGTAREAEAKVRAMVEEAFAIRNLPLMEVAVVSREHVVERCGCVVAAVIFWPE
jgi:arginine decarboxylase